MKTIATLLCGVALTAPRIAAAAVELEAGARGLVLRHARYEASPPPLSVAESTHLAPYVAVVCPCVDWFAVRLSYLYADDLRATVVYGSLPGLPPPRPPTVLVQGYYRD